MLDIPWFFFGFSQTFAELVFSSYEFRTWKFTFLGTDLIESIAIIGN